MKRKVAVFEQGGHVVPAEINSAKIRNRSGVNARAYMEEQLGVDISGKRNDKRPQGTHMLDVLRNSKEPNVWSRVSKRERSEDEMGLGGEGQLHGACWSQRASNSAWKHPKAQHQTTLSSCTPTFYSQPCGNLTSEGREYLKSLALSIYHVIESSPQPVIL